MKTHFLRIADRFYQDSSDYLWRYTITKSKFRDLKCRRFKLFIDLRQAIECSLKAHLAYWCEIEDIKNVEKYNHNLKKLAGAVVEFLPESISGLLVTNSRKLECLPLGVRYAYDAYLMVETEEVKYYETVGSDQWLEQLEALAIDLNQNIGQELQKHSKVVSVTDLKEGLLS